MTNLEVGQAAFCAHAIDLLGTDVEERDEEDRLCHNASLEYDILTGI